MSVDRAMELALFDEEYLEIRRWSVRRRREMESLAAVRTWKPWFPLALEDGSRGAGGTSGHTNGPLCRRNLGGFHIEDNFMPVMASVVSSLNMIVLILYCSEKRQGSQVLACDRIIVG